jgi:succinate dehydrogenase/fumarate reductase flavoprotein subunit
MRDRDSEIMHLRTTSFDLLVIGGGVHGAAIACEAARQGARVADVQSLSEYYRERHSCTDSEVLLGQEVP